MDGKESGMETEAKAVESKPVMRHRWAIAVAGAVIVPIVILAIIEVGLRLAGVGFTTDLLVPCTVKGQPASCYNLFFATPYFPAGMVQTPRLYEIPATKPPGTFRIFVLGESAAMGDPDSGYAFSRYLEVMLRERFPSTRVEVVNTGSVAINSHVLLEIAKGLADQKPDLFIIYSGNNEVVGPYGPGTMLTSVGMDIPLVRSSIFFRSTRIGQLLSRLGTRKQEWRGMEMFLDQQLRADSPLMAHAYRNYERNLRDTIAVAQQAGAKVIVSTVATNLKDCAPFASLHREGLKPDELKSWTALVEQGNNLETAQDYAGALKQYESAAKVDDEYAELEFRIARCLLGVADFKSAREHFARARDLDTLRFRADSKINGINHAAQSVPGVKVIDAEQILSNASPEGVIGSDLVYEHVHLTPEANYILARALFSEIAANWPASLAGSGMESGVMSEAECERRLALTRFDRSRLANDMLGRLQKPPFTNQLNHSEQMLRLAMKAAPSGESPQETVAEYQWAIAQNPDDTMLHLHYGLFLYNYNRMAAAEQLGLAQPWDGYPVFLPDGTQVR